MTDTRTDISPELFAALLDNVPDIFRALDMPASGSTGRLDLSRPWIDRAGGYLYSTDGKIAVRWPVEKMAPNLVAAWPEPRGKVPNRFGEMFGDHPLSGAARLPLSRWEWQPADFPRTLARRVACEVCDGTGKMTYLDSLFYDYDGNVPTELYAAMSKEERNEAVDCPECDGNCQIPNHTRIALPGPPQTDFAAHYLALLGEHGATLYLAHVPTEPSRFTLADEVEGLLMPMTPEDRR